MIRHRSRSLSTAFLALLAVACGPDAAPPVRFGIPSTESSVQLRTSWEPLLQDMQQDLGFEVEAFYATDYAGVIEAMRTGHVDLAWFGNKAAIEAVDRAGGEVFAQTVDGDGHSGYWSVLVVHRDSPLEDVDELLRRASELTFGQGDPNSTSGNVVPMAELFAPRGFDPRTGFARTLQGNHESNALAVARGHVDAAPVDSKVLRRLEVSHPDMYAELRELWRSNLIPSDPLVWRRELDEARRRQIQDWCLSYGADDEERAVLARLDLRGFTESSDDQLLTVRRLELVRDRLRVEQDSSLSEEERRSRLDDLDFSISALGAKIAEMNR